MKKNSKTEDLKLRLNEFSDVCLIQGSQVVNQPTLKSLLFSPTEPVDMEIPKRGLLKSRLDMKL
jgi:hypothetical protein